MNFFSLLICVFLILTALDASNGSTLSRIHIDPSSGHFVDEFGRIRLFRGINSVIKSDPWYDPKLLNKDRQKQISDLGFNVVRLGAMWTGAEPHEDNFNKTYLDIIETLVSDLADVGVYSILDAHQDVLWQYGDKSDKGGYWGVPPWIKDKISPAEHEFPWPFKNIAQWECGYFTEEISNGFEQFYSNVNGTGESFAKFWKTLAKQFRSHSSVLGYEVLNEPWAGNIFKDMSLLLPGVAGSQNLEPLYKSVSGAIREVDDETVLFWEPTTWSYFFPSKSHPWIENNVRALLKKMDFARWSSSLSSFCEGEGVTSSEGQSVTSSEGKSLVNLIGEVLSQLTGERDVECDGNPSPSLFGPGLKTVPGGDEYRNRTVMSWHYYCWYIIDGYDAPYGFWSKFLCDSLMGPTVFNTAKMRREELGGGMMLTEFGLCSPNISNPNTENTLECNFVLELTEKNFQSWTFWDTNNGFEFWNEDGELVEDLVIFFSRPYPMATVGRPYKLTFDVKTRIFEYQFYPDLTIKQPSEIFVPPLHYPQRRYSVSTSENLKWAISQNNENIILVYNTPNGSSNKIEFIRIVPK